MSGPDVKGLLAPMTIESTDPLPNLKAYVSKRFSGLSAAELQLIENAECGKSESHWRSNVPEIADKEWRTLERWNAEHCVRAELIRFLCADRHARQLIDPRGIHVRNVWIERSEQRGEVEKARDDLDIDLDSIAIPFSLYFRNCVIPGGIQMRDTTAGFVAFHYSHIGEIRFDRATVNGVLLLNGNRVRRPIVVRQATIDGSLNLSNTIISFTNEDRTTSCVAGNAPPKDRSTYDIDISWTSIENNLSLDGALVPGRISLEQATVGSLKDSLSIYRQKPSLRGFEYTVLENAESIDQRITMWLQESREQGHRQPFDELVKWLRSDGHEADAVTVAMAREEMIWSIRGSVVSQGRRMALAVLSGGYRWLTGYGYRPHRLLYWFLGAYVFGVAMFHAAGSYQLMRSRLVESSNAPVFDAFSYAADVMLPGALLGPDKDWYITTSPHAPYIALGGARAIRLDYVAIAVRYLLKFFGWISGILLIAAITRRMVRND